MPYLTEREIYALACLAFARAEREDGTTKADLARAFDVTWTAVHNALTRPERSLTKLRGQIIAHCVGGTVSDEAHYAVEDVPDDLVREAHGQGQ